MTYKKVGGLHFVRIGRFGFSFYWSRRLPKAQLLLEQGLASIARQQGC
jgi:hypothetical protein